MLQRRVVHRLAHVGVHAPRRREDALDARRRGRRGEELLGHCCVQAAATGAQGRAPVCLLCLLLNLRLADLAADAQEWSARFAAAAPRRWMEGGH